MEVVLSPRALEEVRYTTERRMIFCSNCGIALHLMTQAEADHHYPPQCPSCRGKIAPAPEKERKEQTLFSPKTQARLTPELLFDVLHEIYAERGRGKCPNIQ